MVRRSIPDTFRTFLAGDGSSRPSLEPFPTSGGCELHVEAMLKAILDKTVEL